MFLNFLRTELSFSYQNTEDWKIKGPVPQKSGSEMGFEVNSYETSKLFTLNSLAFINEKDCVRNSLQEPLLYLEEQVDGI